MDLLFLEGACAVEGLEKILSYAVLVIRVIQIVVPIALIVWGSIDLLKGIIAQDDKKIAASRKPFISRLISAVIVFLLPWIVNYVITTFFDTDNDNDWIQCYKDAAKPGNSVKIPTKIDKLNN